MSRLACMMALLATACQENQAAAISSAAVSPGRGHHLTVADGLAAVQASCENSLGRWHENLVRCDCAGSEEVFVVSRGCILVSELQGFETFTFDPTSGGTQPVLLRQDGLFSVSLRVNDAINLHTARILRGLTLPPSERRVMHTITLGRFSDSNTIPLATRSDDLATTAIDMVFDIDYLTGGHGISLVDNIPSWRKASASIAGDRLPISASYWEAGADCWPACGTISEYHGEGTDIWRVKVDMVAFVPVQRLAYKRECDSEVTVGLLPDGSVNYTNETQWLLHSDPKDELAVTERVLFADRRGRILTPGQSGFVSGDRPVTQDDIVAIRSLLEKPSSAKGVGVAVIENGIDLTDPTLAAVADLKKPAAFSDFVQHGSGLAAGNACEIRNVLQVLGRISPHGTRVARTLTRDLERARLSLLDTSELWWSGDNERGQRWAQFIRERNVRVVAVSQVHGIELPGPTCERLFSDLFHGAPDTLFVVGAGNSGWTNFNSCAQGLARSFDNVLNVAGSTYDGTTLERYSNHGIDTVDLAAPGTNHESEASGRRFSGTSHAAPWVGNLAARYWTAFPHATVAEVKSALFDSCDMEQGLDVACGGSVNEKAFINAIATRRRRGGSAT